MPYAPRPLGDAECFDLITANPPYVPESEHAALDPGIREFEPELALCAGADGLDVIRRVVSGAAAHHAPAGVLAVEVQYDQADRVAELFERAGLSDVQKRKDLGGHERVVSGSA
ncbi:MAG: hypothetical protein IPM35_30050 [Myxococcales bacterium]|nr:hypothetical protein [Myxococcales bacterium]